MHKWNQIMCFVWVPLHDQHHSIASQKTLTLNTKLHPVYSEMGIFNYKNSFINMGCICLSIRFQYLFTPREYKE